MNCYGDAAGNERSSRKGKKSNSNKPKQPRRGLGVAQLEKIRLHNQLEYYSANPHMQMSMGELERLNMIYGPSQPSNDLRWNANNAMFEAGHYVQQGLTRCLFQAEVEDPLMKPNTGDSLGSSTSRISDSNGSQELDLELRLSL